MQLALCALVAMSLGACGRSSLRSVGRTSPTGAAGAPTGQGGASGHPDGGPPGDGSAGSTPDGGQGGASGGAGSVPGRVPVSIAVSPPTLGIAVGGTGNLFATLTFSDGTTADVTGTATWTSDATQTATVRPGGVVVGVRTGGAHVTARVGNLAASATVSVLAQVALVSIAIDPPVATLPIGGALNLRVIGTFNDGSTADVTAMAKFGNDGTGNAVVDAMGHVVANRAGSSTLIATVGMAQAKMTVIVTPATVVSIAVLPPVATVGVGTSVAFTADATLSDGTHADVTAASMWSIDQMVASIDQRGVATGRLAGSKALVTAAFGGRTGTAVLVVTAAPLLSIEVDPVDPVVGIGVELDFKATGLYADGTRVDLTAQVKWSSSSPMILPIDASARAVSRGVGTSIVTASNGTLSGTSTVTISGATLKSITVTPANATASPGGTVAFRAIGLFSDGSNLDITDSVVWSTDPSVAAISNAPGTAGIATALGVGAAKIIATSSGVQGIAVLTVSPATLLKIAITPSSSGVPVGGTEQLVATGGFSDGSVRDITSQVAWASSDTSVATIGNAPVAPGVVTGVKQGMVAVTATLNGVVGMATVGVTGSTVQQIIVSPANATTTAGLRSNYMATAIFSDGTKSDVTTQATWTTDNAMVATISNVAGAAGQLLARAAGTANVIATFGGASGQTQVTVTGAAASSLSIAPIASATPLGTPVQFTATLVLSNGTTRNVTAQATWDTSNPMVATIGRTGRATPVAAGATTITVSYMGLTASTTLEVTDAVPVSIQLTPIAPTMTVGTVTQFNATAIMSDGTTRNVTAMATFVSSAPGVVGITTGGRMGRGRATAVAAGSATITATYMGLTDSTNVTVSDAQIVQISVSPAGLTLPVGARRQFTAQAIFSDGTSMTVTGLATWTSDAPSVAPVSTAGPTRGQVTGVGGGTANISATYMGFTGSVAVTVTPAMLTAVQVTPFNPTLTIGMPLQFVATALYSDGTNVAVTGMATWLSSDPNVAGISNAAGSRGLATSLGKGTTKISATYMNVTGTTTLTVTDATITQIQVTPFAPSIPEGFDRQLAATALYSDGTNRDITSLATWSSGSPGNATVSDALATKGLVNASAAGVATIQAQYGGATGSTNVTVSGAMLKALSIAPGNPTIAVGAIQPFTATGTFDDGTILDVTPFVTWTSSNLDVGDVSNADGSRGEATAFGSGSTTIQAQRSTVIATTTLTVQ
jgi:hypothetical protein